MGSGLMSDQFMEKKAAKIRQLEDKLSQIRLQAQFLGDMSEMHKVAIKEKKLEVHEEEREKVFLQRQVIKARNDSKRVKENLQRATHEYDELYVQA